MLNIKGQEPEENSPQSCGANEHQCRNGECINLDFLCDGQRDCLDGSDESEETCSDPERDGRRK